MCPAGNFDDRAWLSSGGIVEGIEAGIAVGLQEAGEVGQVHSRMFAAAVGAVEVGDGRSGLACEGRSSRT